MDDLSFRAEFHRALDPIAPPVPWLAEAVREKLRARRRRTVRRLALPAPQTSWLLPAVAVLLAIATVVALILGARALRSEAIPIRPPVRGLAAAGCQGWGSSSGLPTVSDKMVTSSVGWSSGALRTTDGGAHWRNVSPADLRADAPQGTDPKAYPPSYTDFFLDSNRAWIARGYGSPTSCFDHVGVFVTSDGGRTWSRSVFATPEIQADPSLQLELDFLDARHGWLMVLAEGRLAPDWFVYSTADGGLDWQPVSRLPTIASFCGVTFISQTVGFLSDCVSSGSSTASLLTTRDGGRTWQSVRLPEPRGTQFTVSAPVFFDQRRGAVHVTAQIVEGNMTSPFDYLAATADGGLSWHALPASPPAGFAVGYAFLDANDFWVLATDGKGYTQALYRTADAGASWNLATADLPAEIQSYPALIFIDPNVGFFLAPSGQPGQPPLAVLRTEDGGHTWTDMHPQSS